MYDGLLIDMGGTLVFNKEVSLENAVHSIYSFIDSKIEYNLFLSTFLDISSVLNKRDKTEIPFQDLLKQLEKQLHFSFILPLKEIEYQFAFHYERLKKIEGIENILQLFHQLKKQVVVLSNSTFTGDVLFRQLESVGISQYITKVFSSADYLIRKPDKQFFQIGINNWSSKAEILYIGNDYYYDIYGGNQAKLSLCWYNPNQEANQANIPCINIQHYSELLKIIERK